MRIRSKFRDYYDYISHRFGSDPDAFFDRRDNIPESVELPPRRGHNDESFDKFSAGFYGCGGTTSEWMIAHIVAGPLVVTTMERSWYDPKRMRHMHMPETLLDPVKHAAALKDDWKGKGRNRKSLDKIGQQEFDPKEVEYLIKAVGMPVFRVLGIEGSYLGKRIAKLDGRAPILDNIRGFSAKYPPEVVWQGIYTTLTSVLRKDPDKAPPVQVAEKYRIEGAGFDLKTSFRHPVNAPAAAAKRKR